MLNLVIPRTVLDEMLEEARKLAPHECCGLLAGKDGRITHHYRIKNIVATQDEAVKELFDQAKVAHMERMTPEERADVAFWMDSKDMFAAQKDMRKQGTDMLASYHSHPVSPARPSPTDIKALASYPDLVHFIVSLQDTGNPAINAFRIVDGSVSPVTYEIG